MAANRATQVLDYMRSHEERLVTLLQTLVDAESPSSQPASHEPVRRALEGAIEACDFAVREVVTPTDYRHLYARPHERKRHSEDRN